MSTRYRTVRTVVENSKNWIFSNFLVLFLTWLLTETLSVNLFFVYFFADFPNVNPISGGKLFLKKYAKQCPLN